MYECLRLYPVIPAVSRITTTDVHLQSCERVIPKGLVVLISFAAMNRNPDIWTNPSEFRPERFEVIQNLHFAKMGFFPFSYGTRSCIGKEFAMIEGQVIMSLILQRFTFAPVPNFKPEIALGISLGSMNGIHVIVRQD